MDSAAQTLGKSKEHPVQILGILDYYFGISSDWLGPNQDPRQGALWGDKRIDQNQNARDFAETKGAY